MKTFAIPKLMFKACVFAMSKNLFKAANSILYNFIWNGKDRVKRNAIISGIEEGGLNMLDIESMNQTKRVTCLKNFLEDYQSPWKTILHKTPCAIWRKFCIAVCIPNMYLTSH